MLHCSAAPGGAEVVTAGLVPDQAGADSGAVGHDASLAAGKHAQTAVSRCLAVGTASAARVSLSRSEIWRARRCSSCTASSQG